MLLTLDNNIDINNIILCEPINNTVMDNSKFIRLIYSDKNIIMNGIYIKISVNISTIEHAYNKLRCYIEPEKNKELCKILSFTEKNILSKYVTDKLSSYKLTECLNKGILKIFNETFIRNQYNTSNKDKYNSDKYNSDKYNNDKYNSDKYNSENSMSLTKNANDSSLYNIVLKISGIWVDEREYGLTYKFITL